MQIKISWLLQKPTDLDLHCLLRQGMSCSAREGLKCNLVVNSCKSFNLYHSKSNSADDKLEVFLSFFFSQKIGFDIYAQCLVRRQFASYVKSCFLWKIIRNISKCRLLQFLPSILCLNNNLCSNTEIAPRNMGSSFITAERHLIKQQNYAMSSFYETVARKQGL